MRRLPLYFLVVATTFVVTSSAWAQADVGPLFTQYWDEYASSYSAPAGEDSQSNSMRMNAVEALDDLWDDSEIVANITRFDESFVFFWVPTGVLVETQSIAGPEGDVQLITASLIDTEAGTGVGTSFITMTYYRNGLNLADQEASASAAQALDITRDQLVEALSGVGDVQTSPVTRRLGGFSVPGLEVAATRGDATTLSFLTALRYGDGAIMTVYFHREEDDRENLDLLGAVMTSIWPGSYQSYYDASVTVGEAAAAAQAADDTESDEESDDDEEQEPIQ